MEYSAGMTSCRCWFAEICLTAEFLLQGEDWAEIRQRALVENCYQVPSADRAGRIASVLCRRLRLLSPPLWQLLALGGERGKVINVVAIAASDRLFGDFLHEVYRDAVILGERNIRKAALEHFFADKRLQSQRVAAFSPASVVKLGQIYQRILRESGVLGQDGTGQLRAPLYDEQLATLMRAAGLGRYYADVTGGVADVR